MNKWYPSAQGQLDTPENIERSVRRQLQMFYELKQQVDEMHKKTSTPPAQVNENNAAITRILGLPVEPSDTSQLADGATLKYVAATRSFKFV